MSCAIDRHDWSLDCEKCASCGASRADTHQWRMGRCSKCGQSIDQPGGDGHTRLTQAAFQGSLELVKVLLDGGAKLEATTKDDFWPLIATAQKGHLDIVKALIAAGANVLASTNVGNTALIAACINGHSEVARVLIEAGSNVNAADIDGNVVLQAAAQNCDTDVVQRLLERGADLHVGTKVCEHIVYNAVGSGRADTVRLLMAHGVPLAGVLDATTLVIVAGSGYLEMVTLLLENGADVNSQEPRMRLSPVAAAAAYGKLDVVKLLVAKGADLSVTDRLGNTVVALAERKQHWHVASYLRTAARAQE